MCVCVSHTQVEDPTKRSELGGILGLTAEEQAEAIKGTGAVSAVAAVEEESFF